jgi:hypothetical protein
MKKLFALALLFSSILFLGSCLKTRTENIDYFLSHQVSTADTTGSLCVNEFCARGSNYLSDELNPASDHWIELYNRTSSTIYFDSTNFYYSNDSTVHSISRMTKLTYYSVPAKGWIVIFADDSDRVVTPTQAHAINPALTTGHIHVPHIGKSGGFIGLYSYTPSTSSLTQLTAYSYDSIPASGDSWGVYPDGSGNWNLYTSTHVTPDAANATP